jgi:type II secretory pathway component PulF
MASELAFQYLAIDASGRQRKGVVAAASDAEAFMLLRADGLSRPVAALDPASGDGAQDDDGRAQQSRSG